MARKAKAPAAPAPATNLDVTHGQARDVAVALAAAYPLYAYKIVEAVGGEPGRVDWAALGGEGWLLCGKLANYLVFVRPAGNGG